MGLKRCAKPNEDDACFKEAERTQAVLPHLAGRAPVGSSSIVGAVLKKQCTRTERLHGGEVEETLVLGAACSEVLSGPRLAKVLRPAVDLQRRALEDLAEGKASEPLSIHTSAGLPSPLGAFVEALSAHLPWSDAGADWFLNLQLEGATAVWAGVEALMRLQQVSDKTSAGPQRGYLAVGERSYHGPKTTALGQPAEARWPGAPRTQGQVPYPLPTGGDTDAEHESFLRRFDAFLDEHAQYLGVILFEPQWGSSFAGRPWPKRTLQEAIQRSRARGILVLCDEIMCGLGRHGQGTLFLSKAWGLEPDAVTFGKSIAAGPFPMSGVAVRKGARALGVAGSKVVQCHTYAGSSALALLTAREVIEEVPKWFEHAAHMGEVVAEILGPCSDGKFFQVQGLGLMWGGLFVDPDAAQRQKALALLRDACKQEGVWPYFVPAGGFMMTPPMDIEESEFRDGLQRLVRCLSSVRAQLAAA
mmetsp:Transcript_122583/g.318703  ORF Transcript_122583/g.318703 Transcript_122583/m.318703 type:complete len:473 (-) Transcript_122583:162-1580(-)